MVFLIASISPNQLIQLNSYSIYPDDPAHKIFSLNDVLDENFSDDFMQIVTLFSENEQAAVSLSYFTKRYGMFIAMQFYMLIVYEEWWNGTPEQIQFVAKEEFGRRALSMTFSNSEWTYMDDAPQYAVHKILHEQCLPVIQALRKITSISPLLIWENIFGYMLWHFHTLSADPMTHDLASTYLQLLEDDATWVGISDKSIWYRYTTGNHPSQLINVPVRKTCCYSKDIPGLMACGFCPLK